MIKQFSSSLVEHIFQPKHDLEPTYSMAINSSPVIFSPCLPWITFKNSEETQGYKKTSMKLSAMKYWNLGLQNLHYSTMAEFQYGIVGLYSRPQKTIGHKIG